MEGVGVHVRIGDGGHGLVERHRPQVAAPLRAPAVADVVDEDVAHGDRRDRKEVGPPAPVRARLVDEAQVGLVDQLGRLQPAVRPAQVVARAHPQVVVDERQQLVGRGAVAAAQLAEQRRDAHRIDGIDV